MRQVDQVTNILTGGKVQINNNNKTSSLLIANTCSSIPSCCTQVYDKEGCFPRNVHGICKGNADTAATTKQTEIAAREKKSSAPWMHILTKSPAAPRLQRLSLSKTVNHHPNYQPHHQIPNNANRINHKLTQNDTTQALPSLQIFQDIVK